MTKLIGNKTLSSDLKLNLLSNYQSRFDKFKKETGVLVGATTEPDAPANEPEPPQQVIITQSNIEEPGYLIEKMGIFPMYRNKAIKLLSKIEKNQNILTYNKDCQVIIKVKLITGTDVESLFKSMISPSPNLDQVGIDRFIGALHEIGVKLKELSGKAVQNKFTQNKL